MTSVTEFFHALNQNYGINLTILFFGIWERDIFFFPLGIAYLSYGLVRGAVIAITESTDTRQSDSEGLVLHGWEEKERRRREPPAASGTGED